MEIENICIIMSTYNGEQYVKEQIESILQQKNVNINIVIRDDGSTDSTFNIISDFKNKNSNISIIKGNNIGCKSSFYEAAKIATKLHPDISYFAFSDQDDVWLPEKAYKGIYAIKSKTEKRPILYFCHPKIVDAKLQPTGQSWDAANNLTFEEGCLVQTCAGCTMIFNRASLDLYLQGNPENMSLHDSWMYKAVLACNGIVLEDKDKYILYRQHGNNVVGTQNFYSRWKRRYNMFLHGNSYRSKQVGLILDTYHNKMTEETKYVAYILSTYKSSIKKKCKIIFSKRFRTGRLISNTLFVISIIFNRY